MSDILPIIDKLWINLNLLLNMEIYRYKKKGLHMSNEESAAFNIGDIVFSSIHRIDRDHHCDCYSNDKKKTNGIKESRG